MNEEIESLKNQLEGIASNYKVQPENFVDDIKYLAERIILATRLAERKRCAEIAWNTKSVISRSPLAESIATAIEKGEEV